jgi:hypothetical protein
MTVRPHPGAGKGAEMANSKASAEVVKSPNQNFGVQTQGLTAKVLAQETGEQVVFEHFGDSVTLLFTGIEHVSTEESRFDILTFLDADGKPYQLNAGWRLENIFRDIPPNTVTTITYVKDVDTGNPSPMKDFRVIGYV